MEVITESSAAPLTCSVVRTLDAEDDASAKRQRLMAGMLILHGSGVDVNVDARKMVVLAATLDDQEQWTQRVIDWDKEHYGAKSGTLLDTQKVYEGRLGELANPLRCKRPEHRAWRSSTGSGWMMRKGRQQTPMRVRSRLVATQVNTYVREDVTQPTPPMRPESL